MRTIRKSKLLVLLSILLLTSMLVACGSSSEAQPQLESEASKADASETLQAKTPQETEGEIKTLFIGPELVDCEGAGPQKCMLVKESPDGEYGLFYDQIEGFDYEEGYEYEIVVEVTKVENPPADASSLKYSLVEVVSKTAVSTEDTTTESALEGTLWVLRSYIDANGDTADVLPDTNITAEFQDGKLAGNAGCNQYFGAYQLDGNALTVAVGGTTMMACPEPVMAQEQAYLAALGSSAAFEISGDQLQIADSEGNTILTYVADQPPSLTGTDWQLMSYNNGKGGLVSSLATELITAVFGDDGKLTGFAACNNYHAPYEVDGGSIAIGPAAATRKMCAEPVNVMEDEAGYFQALERAAEFEIKDGQLTMYDEEGTRQLVYRVATDEAASAPTKQPVDAVADQSGVATTYRTILPSDRGDVLLVILTLDPDGTVTLITDHLDDEAGEAPIEQTGAWETTDDGNVIVTVADDKGEESVYEFEVRDGHLHALEYDVTLFGEQGLPLHPHLASIATTAKRAFLTLDLDAGFPLDPFFVSVNGGGDLDAGMLAEGCSGFIHQQPVVSLDWEGEADFAEFFFYSDHDPTLVIQTPDGEYLCSDDTNPLLLDPSIEIQNPAKGEYDIWVGSFHPNQLLPGVLVLTTRPDVNIGNFSLDNLITRPAVPEILETAEGRKEAEQLLQTIEQHQGDIEKLSAGGEPFTVELTGEGKVPAFEYDIEDQQCTGFISEVPDYVFDWSGTADEMAIFFEGDADSSLVVVQPGGEVICNDDSITNENVNPLLIVSNPAEGLYAVFVGHLNPDVPISGKLTITDVASVQPALLNPTATQ